MGALVVAAIPIAGRVPWFYLSKLFWPEPLIFIYPRWQISADDVLSLLPGFALAGLAAWLVAWRERATWTRPVLFAGAYFLVSLFPVLGFFDVYFFRYSFVGDHFQYLASMGVLAAAGSAVASWKRGTVAGAVLIVGLGALSARHARMFVDDRTLWHSTVERNPSAWIARNNFAKILIDEGRYAEAIAHLEHALRLKPDHQEAHYNLGNALRLSGAAPRALPHYAEAVRLNADDANARNNLAGLLMQAGQVTEAAEHYEQLLRLRPNWPEAHYNFANMLVRLRRFDEARAAYETALRLRSDYAAAHNDLAILLMDGGRTAEALSHFEAAVEAKPGLRPDFEPARRQLAQIRSNAAR